MATEKELSPFQLFRQKQFPNLRWTTTVLKQAGKLFSKGKVDLATDLLREKGRQRQPGNAKPPVRCHIMAMSRPIQDWPLYKVSIAVQEFMFKQSKEDFDKLDPDKSTASHTAWFANTGVDQHGYTSTQGLNLVFNTARKRYLGVETKIKNRNDKKNKYLLRKNEKRSLDGLEPLPLEEESAYNPDGTLAQPPGINPNLYLGQFAKLKAWTPKAGIPLTGTLEGYDRDPNCPIPTFSNQQRTEIPEGSPGHIPLPHLMNISAKPNKRIHKYFANQREKDQAALLVTAKVDQDWIVFDARGLLRNARYRKLITKKTTLNELLELFTADPVVNTQHNYAVFCYKEGTIDLVKGEVRRPSEKLTSKLLQENTAVGLLAVDLGQNNFVAAQVYKVADNAGTPQLSEPLAILDLPAEVKQKLQSNRLRTDALSERLRKEAKLSLTPEQQHEIYNSENLLDERTQAAVLQMFNKPHSLDWGTMSTNSYKISDALLTEDSTSQVFRTVQEKGKASRQVKISDYGWSLKLRPKLPEATRTAWTLAHLALQRTSEEYRKLSVSKDEDTRHGVNTLIKQAQNFSGCQTVVVAMEDLNVRFMHGSGKRKPGWRLHQYPY